MQNRKTKKIADIEFSLINQLQYEACDKAVSKDLAKLAPAVIDHFCMLLGVEVKQFKVGLPINAKRAVFGYKVQISVLLDEASLDSEKLKADMAAAVKVCARIIDPDLKVLNFHEINPADFSVTYSDESTEKMSFKGRVKQRSYEYTKLDETESVGVSFVNETEHTMHRSHSKSMTYDAFGNITSITYDYKPCVSSEADLAKLDAEAEALLHTKFKAKYKPFLQSVKDRNFGQALRRACAAGEPELFVLLANHANAGVFDLDLNEFAVTNKMTALDYALESQNEMLIQLLRNNGAKTFKQCILRLVENDREEIYRLNPRRKQNPFFANFEEPEHGFGMYGMFGNTAVAQPEQQANRFGFNPHKTGNY